MHPTLSIIGGGKVGRTLGRLWADAHQVTIHDVLNRSLASAEEAVAFIGAGQAIGAYMDLQPSDIYMIATPDDAIEAACNQLTSSVELTPANIVFHCSGAGSSALLQSAAACGAAVASIHPIRSFAQPEHMLCAFTGTYCGAEGNQRALQALEIKFNAIGARFVAIRGEQKVLYHAAAVIASNYLVTLLDLAQQAYMQAGVAPDMAMKLMEPLVRETMENVFRTGPAAALTGPIARGDIATVERQQLALDAWSKPNGDLYRDFVTLTGELAARR